MCKDYVDFVGPFKLIVKSGEVHKLEADVEENGCIQGTTARPRAIWVPCKDGQGIMQAVQGYFWKWLKKHVPEFVHG